MNHATNTAAEHEVFEQWCKTAKHPEGGYKLARLASGAYIDPETRCTFRGFQAGRATQASTEPVKSVLAAECLNTMLWLYHRLPRGYERVPLIERTINAMAVKLGIDVESCLAERGAAPSSAPSTEPTDEVIDRQVSQWRKEVARLQDLIATATGAPSTAGKGNS